MIRTIEAGVLYFALVFGAGFVLGTIRTLWVVPRVGTRTAELMETPIMLVVTIVAARSIILRLSLPFTPSARLGMGVDRAPPPARRGVRVRALASRANNS
jgi:hypothetical protein